MAAQRLSSPIASEDVQVFPSQRLMKVVRVRADEGFRRETEIVIVRTVTRVPSFVLVGTVALVVVVVVVVVVKQQRGRV